MAGAVVSRDIKEVEEQQRARARVEDTHRLLPGPYRGVAPGREVAQPRSAPRRRKPSSMGVTTPRSSPGARASLLPGSSPVSPTAFPIAGAKPEPQPIFLIKVLAFIKNRPWLFLFLLPLLLLLLLMRKESNGSAASIVLPSGNARPGQWCGLNDTTSSNMYPALGGEDVPTNTTLIAKVLPIPPVVTSCIVNAFGQNLTVVGGGFGGLGTPTTAKNALNLLRTASFMCNSTATLDLNALVVSLYGRVGSTGGVWWIGEAPTSTPSPSPSASASASPSASPTSSPSASPSASTGPIPPNEICGVAQAQTAVVGTPVSPQQLFRFFDCRDPSKGPLPSNLPNYVVAWILEVGQRSFFPIVACPSGFSLENLPNGVQACQANTSLTEASSSLPEMVVRLDTYAVGRTPTLFFCVSKDAFPQGCTLPPDKPAVVFTGEA